MPSARLVSGRIARPLFPALRPQLASPSTTESPTCKAFSLCNICSPACATFEHLPMPRHALSVSLSAIPALYAFTVVACEVKGDMDKGARFGRPGDPLCRKETTMFPFSLFNGSFSHMHRSLCQACSTTAAGSAGSTGSSFPLVAEQSGVLPPADVRDAAIMVPAIDEERLKSLYRRTLRSRRDSSLTYSGTLRHSAG